MSNDELRTFVEKNQNKQIEGQSYNCVYIHVCFCELAVYSSFSKFCFTLRLVSIQVQFLSPLLFSSLSLSLSLSLFLSLSLSLCHSLPLPPSLAAAVVEHVRDGSTLRVILLPNFTYLTVAMSGVKVKQTVLHLPASRLARKWVNL